MSEKTCYFGPDNTLFGIVTRTTKPRKNAPAILLVTSGLLHHIGPYRLYVHLARKLANLGFTVMRIDLGGIGDSGHGANDFPVSERSNHEIGHAMDFLQNTYAIDEFVSMGLCSGADDSLKIAVNDDRISGCLFLDGPGFRTPAYYLRHYLLHYPRRLLSLQKWKHLASRHLGKSQSVDSGEVDFRDFPTQKLAERQLQGLLSRGIKACFIYTGGVSDYYNYAGQFKAMFPALKGVSGVESKYFPKMDHMAILQSDREHIINCVVEWIDRSFTNCSAIPSTSEDATQSSIASTTPVSVFQPS